MKKAILLCCLQIGLGLQNCAAQLVSGNVFLKGNYLEAGIAKNGTLGSGILPPAGYHFTTMGTIFNSLGLLCDRDMDGWTVGTPSFYGDFVVVGMPMEGWALQANGVKVIADKSTSDSFMSVGLSGAHVNVVKGSKTIKTLWRGAWNDLYIEQYITMDIDKKYLLFDIVLENRGSSTLYDMYYNRSVDVDHEEDPSDPFNSGFKIEHQVPNAQELVVVSGSSKSYQSYLGLVANDCRAKAYYLHAGLSTDAALDSLYAGLGASASNSYAEGDSLYIDAAMGMVFKLDSLRVKETKHFHFAYLADKADLAALLVETKKATLNWTLNKWHNSKDTGYMCEGDPRTITVNAVGSEDWVWATSPYLSTLTGPAATFIAPPGSYSLSATRNNTDNCGGSGLDTIYMNIVVLEKPKPVIVRASPTALTTTKKYTELRWYKNGVYIANGDTLKGIVNAKYTVMVKDSNGCENTSFAVLVDDAFTIGIEEIKKHSTDFVVFPNPNKGTMTLKLLNAAIYESAAMVKITDFVGRVVQQTAVDFQNSLGHLQLKIDPGVYLLEIQDKSGTTQRARIVIE